MRIAALIWIVCLGFSVVSAETPATAKPEEHCTLITKDIMQTMTRAAFSLTKGKPETALEEIKKQNASLIAEQKLKNFYEESVKNFTQISAITKTADSIEYIGYMSLSSVHVNIIFCFNDSENFSITYLSFQLFKIRDDWAITGYNTIRKREEMMFLQSLLKKPPQTILLKDTPKDTESRKPEF